MAEQEIEVENILEEILAGDDLTLYGYEEDPRSGLVSHAPRARPLLSQQQPAQPLQTAHHSQPLQNSQCSDSSEPSHSSQHTQRGQPVQMSLTTPIGRDAQASASNAGGGRRQRSPSLDQSSQARTQKRIRSAQDVEESETAAEPSRAPPQPGSSKRLRTSIDLGNGRINVPHAEEADRPDDIIRKAPDGKGTDDYTNFSDHRDRLRHTTGAQRTSHHEDWHSITKDSVTHADTSPVKPLASGENQYERSLNRSPYSSQRGQERNDRTARPYQDGYRSTVQRGQQGYHEDDPAMSMSSRDSLLRRNSGSPRRNAPAIKPADKELQRSYPTSSYRGDNDRPRREEGNAGGQGRLTGMGRNGMSRANREWDSPQSQASSSNSGSIEWTNADVEDAILTGKDRPIMGSRSPIREDVARNSRRGSDPMMMSAGRMDNEPPRYDDMRYGPGLHGRETNGHLDGRLSNLSINRPHDREPGLGNGWNNDPRPYGRVSRTMTRSEERYFVIKSNNYQNVRKSMKEGIWATPAFNAPVLSDAFKTSSRVFLIFSVNESRHFQGYCEMISDVGAVKHWQWTRFNDSSNNFRVRWIQIVDLPFDLTTHIRNPLNENKPVKISRDGQELPRDVGERLRELFDNMTVSNKRVARSAPPPPPPPPPREFARSNQYDPYPPYYQDDYDSHSSNRDWYYEHSGSNDRAPYWDNRR